MKFDTEQKNSGENPDRTEEKNVPEEEDAETVRSRKSKKPDKTDKAT